MNEYLNAYPWVDLNHAEIIKPKLNKMFPLVDP